MQPPSPLDQSRQDMNQATVNGLKVLAPLASDPPSQQKLQTILQEVNKPNGNHRGAAVETYNMLDQVRNKALLAAQAAQGNNDALGAQQAGLLAQQALTAMQDLQNKAAVANLQEKELLLAQAVEGLAATIQNTNTYYPHLTNKQLTKLLNRAQQTRLATVADALSAVRILAETYNVQGVAFEVMSLTHGLLDDMKTHTNDPSLPAFEAQLKKAQQAVYKANADYQAEKMKVSQQPHQAVVTVHNAFNNFAQQVVSSVQPCQETYDEIDMVTQHGEKLYNDIEHWFYMSLRKDSPDSAARNQVNVGFTSGSPDPLFPGINAKTLEADHIVAMKILTTDPNFPYLTTQDKLKILNDSRNFTGLSRKPNASKGDKTYDAWYTYLAVNANDEVTAKSSLKGKKVDVAEFQKLIQMEQTLQPILSQEIAKLADARRQTLATQYPYYSS